MRWAGHVARMGREERRIHGFGGKLEGKRPVGRPRLMWDIVLRCIFRKWDGGIWTGSS